MVRYLETFFRHRVLVVAPLVICLAISLAIVAIQPRSYASSAKIWVDRPLLTATTPSNIYQTPADEQTAVLSELVKARSFCVLAAVRGPLPANLQQASKVAARQPIPRVLAKLQGQHSTGTLTSDQLDSLVFQTISQNTTVLASGPNIVTITFTYANPDVAAATVQGIIDQYVDEVLKGQRAEAQGSVDFYTAQLASARTDLSAADTKVLQYLDAHPDQKLPTAIPDASLSQLKLDDDEARTRYQTLQTDLDNAELQAAITQESTPNGFRMIDPPLAPNSPVSRLKLLLEGGGAGAGSGLLISLLCLIGLTLLDTSIRSPQDVETAIGYRLVGSVPRIA